MLKEHAAHAFNSDQKYHDLVTTQIKHLEVAKNIASEHSKLVNDVYDIDERIEDHVSSGGRKLGEIHGEIFALHKQIGELSVLAMILWIILLLFGYLKPFQV